MKGVGLAPLLLVLILLTGCDALSYLFISARQDPLAQPLIDAAGRGDTTAVDQLLQAGAPLDDPLVLQAAVLQKQTAMVRHLVDRGAPVNGDGRLQSPLWFAAAHGDIDMTGLLISIGADVDWQTEEMGTPLHAALYSLAAHGRRTDVARTLLHHGAKVNLAQLDPMLRRECLATHLHAAVFALDEEAIDLLIESGAELQALDDNGRSALQCARERLVTFRSESERPQLEAIIALLAGTEAG